MLQVRISLLVIVLVENGVRHYLEESGAVDGASVGKAQVSVPMDVVFQMYAGQT